LNKRAKREDKEKTQTPGRQDKQREAISDWTLVGLSNGKSIQQMRTPNQTSTEKAPSAEPINPPNLQTIRQYQPNQKQHKFGHKANPERCKGNTRAGNLLRPMQPGSI